MVTYYNPTDLPSPPYYSHSAATRGGRLVFVSGQAPLDAEGQLVGRGDARGQAEQVFANLRRALEAAGAGVSDLVSVETFYVSRSDLPAYAQARRDFFEGRESPPVSTTVQVAGLVTEGALFEVSAVAVVPQWDGSGAGGGAVNVVATIRAQDGKADDLERALRDNAEKSRREQGRLSYDLHRGLDDPNLFALYETWSDRAALKAHFEMPYMKELAARRDELIEQYKMDVVQRIA